MRLRPTFDNVLVERDIEAGKTKGGILLPDTARTKMSRGEVLAVGPGRMYEGKLNKPPAEKGDRVIFLAFAGTEIEVDERTLLLLAAKDIIAVVEDE